MASIAPFVTPLIRTTALCNTYTLLLRPWIIRQPVQGEDLPSTAILSALYTILQPLLLAGFWHLGFALDAWIWVLLLSTTHINLSEVCVTSVVSVRVEKRHSEDYERSNSAAPWRLFFTKLSCLLSVATAAGADAALMLLASDTDASWLRGENDTLRLLLKLATLPVYLLSVNGDMNILHHAWGLEITPASFRALASMALNLIVVLAGRAALGWGLSFWTSSPLLKIMTCVGLDYRALELPPRDKMMKRWAEGQASKVQVGSQVTQMICMCLSGFFLGQRRRELARQDEQANVAEGSKAVA